MEPPVNKRRRLSSSNARELTNSADEEPRDSDEHSTSGCGKRLASTKEAESSRSKPRKSIVLPPKSQSQSPSGESNSSIFKLQVDELLTRMTREYDRQATKIETTLHKLKSIIEALPELDEKPVVEAEQRLRKLYAIRIPFPGPRPGENTTYSLSYAKPADISVVGNHFRQTMIKSEEISSVDLAVTMPSHIFQEKDYLNYRYFHKRAYYLSCLACGLRNAENRGFSVRYAYQNDNELQPILIIDSATQSVENSSIVSKWQIRILLATSQEVFPIAKTSPNKNCVRLKNAENSLSEQSQPTPFYNASLRSECCTLSYATLLDDTATQCEAFGDTCKLGSVWLRQRGFGTGVRKGGFGPSEWSCLLALLMQGGGLKGKPMLSQGYNKIQLFKATLHFLCTRDLVANPLLLQAAKDDVTRVTGPIFFDGSRGLNLLYKMTRWSYQMMRHEAGISLQMMNAPLSEPFHSLFINRVDEPLQKFDSIIRLSIPGSYEPLQETDPLDHETRFCQHVDGVLVKGLGDRASLVYCWCSETAPWSTDLTAPSKKPESIVSVGIVLNAEQAFRAVDYGPPSEDKAAAAQYRQFWGEKAELRRFQDGSLLETLVWAHGSGESVIKQMVKYIIRRHCGQDIAGSLHMTGDTFNDLISDPGPADPASAIMAAFEQFEKDIRSLEGFPLQIRQITAASPHLRYASLTDAPGIELTKRPRGGQPVDVCVQFEGSARWPNDVTAVQRTKIAFLCKIGELLEATSREGLTTRVGLENEKSKLVNIAFLDVVYPQKAVFRVRIHHEREISLLEDALNNKTSGIGKREEIAAATATYKRTFVHKPRHTQAVRTLCTRFPLLSPGMRLMKKWRNSQLLSGHVSDELVELLTIHVFVTPDPWQAPGSLGTAFLRTLSFISKWQWQTEPLIVDFNGSMSSQDVDGIKLRFEAWRKIDPAMNRVAMFAASNLDPDGITWSEPGPVKVVAARFTALARAACQLVSEQGLDVQSESLFTSSIVDYDFVILLCPKFTTQKYSLGPKKPAFKNLQVQTVEDLPYLGADPVTRYTDELRSLFGSNALFFYNELGGCCIGGTWNPQTGPRRWKINVAYSTIPLFQDGEESMTLNKHATLNDIARLGGDMVSKIQIRGS